MLLLVIPPKLFPQWTATNGAYGCNTRCVLLKNNHLYAGSWGAGLWRTTNEGISWSQVYNIINIVSLAIFNSNILLGGSMQYGIHYSTDDGNTWAPSGLNGKNVLSIAVKDNLVFASFSGATPPRSGVMVSSDTGATWSLCFNKTVRLLVSGNKIFAGADTGLYVSTNNGQNWILYGLNTFEVLSLGKSGSYLFAGTNDGIFRSTDDGVSWTRVYNSTQGITTITGNGSVVYAGGVSGGLIYSTNNGLSWIPDHYFDFYKVAGISFSILNNKIYIGTSGPGIYSTTNNGSSWEQIGVYGSTISSFIESNNELFASTYYGVFKLTNGGPSWYQIPPFTALSIYSLGQNGTYLFASGTDGISGATYRSSDNGNTWSQLPQFSTNPRRYATCFVTSSNGTLFAGCDTNLYWSTSAGNNWSGPYLPGLKISALAYKDPSMVFAGTFGSGLYISTNNGVGWQLSGFSTGSYILSITANQNNGNIYASVGNNSWLVTTIWYSTNNGVNWIQTNFNANVAVTSLIVEGTGNIIAGTNGGGCYISTNNGSTWIQKSEGLPAYINQLYKYGTYVYAGVAANMFDHSIYRRPINELITDISINNNSALKYELYQNYPNPFNNVTRIKFNLPLNTYVRLCIYDINGKLLTILVDRYLKAGVYQYNFDAGQLASGVYFYRVETENFSDSKKMLLIK